MISDAKKFFPYIVTKYFFFLAARIFFLEPTIFFLLRDKNSGAKKKDSCGIRKALFCYLSLYQGIFFLVSENISVSVKLP